MVQAGGQSAGAVRRDDHGCVGGDGGDVGGGGIADGAWSR